MYLLFSHKPNRLSLFYTFGGPEKDLDLNYTLCFIYKVYFTNADIRAGKTVPSNNEKIPPPFC